MSIYLDEYIKAFWEAFEHCNSKESYKLLLKKLELMSEEILSQLEEDELTSFNQNHPLLAMISEIELACPEAVYELAEENVIFSTAVLMFANYNEEDRKYLRRKFLGRTDDNVVYVNFDKEKRVD